MKVEKAVFLKLCMSCWFSCTKNGAPSPHTNTHSFWGHLVKENNLQVGNLFIYFSVDKTNNIKRYKLRQNGSILQQSAVTDTLFSLLA